MSCRSPGRSLITDQHVIALSEAGNQVNVLGGQPLLNIGTTAQPLGDFGVTVGWDTDTIRGSYNSSAIASRAGPQEADFSTVHIGRSPSGIFAPGLYYQLAIWPFCMADADLQAKAVAYA